MRNPKSLPAPFPAKIYTSKTVLESIQNCIKEMKDNWKKIRAFNVSDKGAKPMYDLKAIYKRNVVLEDQIINLKLYSICINLGFKSINQIPKESSFPTIYVLSQLKSRKENLLTIGTKFNSKTETIVLNKKFIEKEIKTLDKAIIKCESELTEFNKLASLSVYQAAA